MTDRDRLIELIKKGVDISRNVTGLFSWGDIADHLLANGVIVPPCKVEDTVYVITLDSPTGIEKTKVSQIKTKVKENGKISYRISAPCVYDTWGEAHWTFCAFEFGKTVFLTKEEAEEKLKELKGNGT